jgi:hypothetical protein
MGWAFAVSIVLGQQGPGQSAPMLGPRTGHKPHTLAPRRCVMVQGAVDVWFSAARLTADQPARKAAERAAQTKKTNRIGGVR